MLLKSKNQQYHLFILTLILFSIGIGQKSTAYSQLKFVQQQDSCAIQFCIGDHSNIQTPFYDGSCQDLTKDTLALIELLLTHYSQHSTNSCDLLASYISGKTAALAAPEGFSSRSSIFAVWYYSYQILFLNQSSSKAAVYIKDCRLGLHQKKQKITDTFFANDAMSRYQSTEKLKKIHRKKTKKIHKLYQKWLRKIKRLGLSKAREKNIHPLKCSTFRWN